MRAGRFQSVARFLYTQNPFYLISCGLIFYGIQLAIPQQASLESRTLILLGSIAAYTLLMSLTAICVIRFGRVWDDARSILMILIIGMLGMSASFDELCVNRWPMAVILALGCLLFSITVTECVLLLTRIRFTFLYRIPFYAMLAIFFAGPVIAGYAVAENHQFLKNWAAPFFSTAIAVCLITMSPALRRGKLYLLNNGTPWPWPLYPLSPFVVLVALGAIRSHGIWMSFSSLSGPIAFEPFLLMPLGLAIAMLVLESETTRAERPLSVMMLIGAGLLFFCGQGRAGLTALPIQEDIAFYFGSAGTLILLSLIGFYLFAFIKRVPAAEYFLAFSLLALLWTSPIPEPWYQLGVRSWMFPLLASAVMLGNCLAQPRDSFAWFVFGVFLAIAAMALGTEIGQPVIGNSSAALIGYLTLMIVGAIFQGDLAVFLRACAAAVSCIVALAILILHFGQRESAWLVLLLGILTLVPLVYLQIVKRRGWLVIVSINASCCLIACLLLTQQKWEPMVQDQRRLVIPIGIMCFLVAAGISFVKTGAHRQFYPQFNSRKLLSQYQIGL
jgi:hypothetical protein